MQAEVERLIENWARWPGWESGSGSRSPLAWLDDFVANKRVGEFYQAVVPVMGGEAADTHRALGRIDTQLGQVLVVHYTWGHRTIEWRLHLINKPRASKDRMSRRTYFYRLAAAHPAFMTEFRALHIDEKRVTAVNTAAQAHAPESVARRHRLLVKASMGLKTPEKEASDENGR
jgi:hypothetical protein